MTGNKKEAEKEESLQYEIEKIEGGYLFKTNVMEAISRGEDRKAPLPQSESNEIFSILEKYKEPEIYRELLFSKSVTVDYDSIYCHGHSYVVDGDTSHSHSELCVNLLEVHKYVCQVLALLYLAV